MFIKILISLFAIIVPEECIHMRMLKNGYIFPGKNQKLWGYKVHQKNNLCI
jgi:hypothetical protein